MYSRTIIKTFWNYDFAELPALAMEVVVDVLKDVVVLLVSVVSFVVCVEEGADVVVVFE